MIATRQAGWVLVNCDADDINSFNASWPCSPIPDDSTILFEFDTRNGDLVNITMHLESGECVDSSAYDGDALLALSHDATNFAVNAYMLPTWAKKG